jgi:hypothetical protein
MQYEKPLHTYKVNTIGTLKLYLRQLESCWTSEDTECLGSFDSQPIVMNSDDGFSPAYIEYHDDIGLFIRLD